MGIKKSQRIKNILWDFLFVSDSVPVIVRKYIAFAISLVTYLYIGINNNDERGGSQLLIDSAHSRAMTGTQ
jgi:hypothetical protein